VPDPGRRYRCDVRVLLIANPSASSVTPRARVIIEKALAGDHEVEVAETHRRGHATRLAQSAATSGVDVVAVLGGDGTLNEAANGLVGTDTALAALPGGSTNVFARTLGLPDEPVDATLMTLEAIAAENIRTVGLGSVNRRYFLFHCGVGFDAAVVEQVERRGDLKRYANHALFGWAALATFVRHYDHSSPRFCIRFPDGTSVDDAYFTICLNTNPYTFVGSRPFDIAPEATLDRGLAAVTLRSLKLRQFLPVLANGLLSPEKIRASPAVDYRTDLTELEIIGHSPFPYQVDGDFLGTVRSLRLRHEPNILRLVEPVPDKA